MNFDIYVLSRKGPYSTTLYYRNYAKRKISINVNERIGSLNSEWTDDIKKASVWTTKNGPNQVKKRLLKENKFARSSDYWICRFTAIYQSGTVE